MNYQVLSLGSHTCIQFVYVLDTKSRHSDGCWQESESSHRRWTNWRWIHDGKSFVTYLVVVVVVVVIVCITSRVISTTEQRNHQPSDAVVGHPPVWSVGSCWRCKTLFDICLPGISLCSNKYKTKNLLSPPLVPCLLTHWLHCAFDAVNNVMALTSWCQNCEWMTIP